MTSFKTTNWKYFRKTIDRDINITENFRNEGEIETEVEKLTNIITKAAKLHSRQVKVMPGKIKISDNTKILIHTRNQLRKIYQRHPNPFLKTDINYISTHIRKEIKQTINKEWENTLTQIQPGENRVLWRIAKAFRRTCSNIPTITENNRDYMTDEEKSNIIADTLEMTQINNEKSPLDNTVQNKILTDLASTNNRIHIKKTTFPEIKKLIKLLPNNKAPGHDTI